MERLNNHGNDFSPTAWNFEGSDDGINWVVLDTQKDINIWSNGEVKGCVAMRGPRYEGDAGKWFTNSCSDTGLPGYIIGSASCAGECIGNFLNRVNMSAFRL